MDILPHIHAKHKAPWAKRLLWVSGPQLEFYHHITNKNVVHDVITRDVNSVSWAEILEFSSHNLTLSMSSPSEK